MEHFSLQVWLVVRIAIQNLYCAILLGYNFYIFSWKFLNIFSVSWTSKCLHYMNNIMEIYSKFPKYSDIQKHCCNHSKIWTMWFYHTVMSPNEADGMANSVDPDRGAVWSGSAVFAQTYLSENLGSLRYQTFMNWAIRHFCSLWLFDHAVECKQLYWLNTNVHMLKVASEA